MTPVRVLGLREGADDSMVALVVETLDGGHVLGFHIQPGEAARLARVLGLARCWRVPIYDLVEDVAASLGGRVTGAILDAQADGIHARVRVASRDALDGEREIACHPADAVALALRSDAPVLATVAALGRSTAIATPVRDSVERGRVARAGATGGLPGAVRRAGATRRMSSVMTPLLVVTLASEVGGNRAGIVVRTTDQDLELVLEIPPSEAARLAQVMGLTPCACAPLYTLGEALLARADTVLERAVLDGQPEGITARLALTRAGRREELDCHPADAVALALRRSAPLMATAAALAHAHRVEASADDEALRAWLSRVTPGDFLRDHDDGAPDRPRGHS